MKLYSYFRSSCSYRVRIALNLKNLSYETIPIHLVNEGGEQHSPHYKKLNPSSQVPSLTLDNGNVINQSLAIISYLDAEFTGHSLFPKDTFKKAKVLEFCEIINSGIQPIQNLKVMQTLKNKWKFTAEQTKEWNKHWITEGLLSAEKFLENTSGKYCFTNEITAADCLLVPQVYNAHRFDVDMSKLPLMHKIELKCLEHKAFIQAHPDNQPDTPA